MSHRRHMTARVLAPTAAGLLTITCVATAAPAAVADTPTGTDTSASAPSFTEPYRPQFHFTPAKNWMNDPNGLVYYKGEYHLFFQYNPSGNQWGNMSWGHAVSKDLVHWKELPLAIPHEANEAIFSGSAVVDRDNTSGLGTAANPAMIAIYTSAYDDGRQAQSLAYSLDRGRTWTKYSGNPVLDIGSNNFRDPKVQWYAPTKSWLMTVSLSDQHKVRFYSSKDLKNWTVLSEFGPAGATGGAWECPDLFRLPVDGDGSAPKWVLVVNLNPGGIAGGSSAQYFVGDFDGTTFTPDKETPYTPPKGTSIEDFERSDYAPWTSTGTAFSAPTQGAGPGQLEVSGYSGTALANSFTGGDASTGTLTSPAYTATSPFVNFLVGGGRHPHDPAATLDPPAPSGTVFADFEGATYGDWTATGNAFGTGPAQGTIGDQQAVTGYLGHGLVNTFLTGDSATGTLTSPSFTIGRPYIDFLVGGGTHPEGQAEQTAVNLVVDGKVVRTATGSNAEALAWTSWDVREFAGKTARIEVVDANTGGWGHINVDQILFSDAPAQPVSTETSVNLVVNGQIVQSVTGPDSETLDWASFDLRPYQAQKYRITLIDANTGGWGHILADGFTASSIRAQSALERAHWVDYGRDYYAAVTWVDAPHDRVTQIGWMNNWDYAGAIPTSPWRSATSIPRNLALKTIGGQVRLVAQPVKAVKSLRVGHPVVARHVSLAGGNTTLHRRLAGKALDITADFAARNAKKFGVKVAVGNGQETLIGYDVANQRVYIDRTKSGDSSFDKSFAGVQSGPLPLVHGKVHLRILVDASSVEVFAGDGQTVLTDQIFPDPSNTGVRLFSEGGSAKLTAFKAWHLRSYRR